MFLVCPKFYTVPIQVHGLQLPSFSTVLQCCCQGLETQGRGHTRMRTWRLVLEDPWVQGLFSRTTTLRVRQYAEIDINLNLTGTRWQISHPFVTQSPRDNGAWYFACYASLYSILENFQGLELPRTRTRTSTCSSRTRTKTGIWKLVLEESRGQGLRLSPRTTTLLCCKFSAELISKKFGVALPWWPVYWKHLRDHIRTQTVSGKFEVRSFNCFGDISM